MKQNNGLTLYDWRTERGYTSRQAADEIGMGLREYQVWEAANVLLRDVPRRPVLVNPV